MLIPREELLDVTAIALESAAFAPHRAPIRLDTSRADRAPLVVGSRPEIEAQLRHMLTTLVQERAAGASLPGEAPLVQLSATAAPGDPSWLDLCATLDGETAALRLRVAGA